MRSRRGGGLGVLAAALLLLAGSGAAEAHSGRAVGGPDNGIAIDNLTHGQMSVIARHSRAILDLAARVPAPDQDFRRVLNYARIQQTYCAWGLMPGAVSDETSPFNECSHAYLAASRDLLLRMAALPGGDGRIDGLMRAVELDMMQNRTGVELCLYSDERFNTANILRPDWGAVPGHGASLAALVLAALAAGGVALVAGRVLRRASQI